MNVAGQTGVPVKVQYQPLVRMPSNNNDAYHSLGTMDPPPTQMLPEAKEYAVGRIRESGPQLLCRDPHWHRPSDGNAQPSSVTCSVQ